MLKFMHAGLFLLSLSFCACQSSSPEVGSSSAGDAKTGASTAPLPDAGRMIKRMITQDGCKDFVADMRMTSESAEGKRDHVDVRLQRKYSTNGVSTFMTVLYPKEESNKAILAIEDNEKPTEAFSYLAGFKKLTTLNSSRSLGFRGAKVTVQELLGMELGHYSHDAGERINENGESLIKIVFQARPELNLVFPSIVGYFREKEEAPARFELFGENGDLAKKMVIEEVKLIQNRQTVTQVSIEDVSQKLKLKMETQKIEYDRGLPDRIFTQEHLKNVITEASSKQ